MASSLGCTIMENKFRYLGVMVGAGMTRHKAWDDVILKLQSRLSKWKAKTLSIGGRLTLLKSVLGASPLYNMSIFKVPKGVLKVMESIRSNFFKGASMLEKKISWIAWDKVLASKKKGGLGVSSYFALNRALLLKWVWRFVSQDDSLWFRVIQAVHGDKIDSHSVRKVSIWSSILKEVQVLKSSGFDFLSYCSKRIGDGQSTSFWKETWNRGKFLCEDTRLAIDVFGASSHSEPTRGLSFNSIKILLLLCGETRRGVCSTSYNLRPKRCYLESILPGLFRMTRCPSFVIRCSLSQAVLHVFAVGGDRFQALASRSQYGTSGSLLFVFRVQLKVFWKESSTLLGGLFGDFGIVLLLMLISRLDRSFLRILSLPPFFGVIVGVVGSSLGMIGLKTRI
ncbi:hypothetical protein Tco_0850629 [Tanacetum coccineum]